MAIKTITQHICDRCQKVYDEASPTIVVGPPSPSPPKVAVPGPMVYISLERLEADKARLAPVKFDDLCSKCQGRVLDLVAQIRLEAAPPKDEQPLDGSSKTKETPTKSAEAKAADAKQTTH